MIKEKGIYELLQAFRIASSSSDIELIYVGSGGELDNLKSIVTSENLARIKFLGPLHGVDLQQAYEMADLLVLPSHDEAFPYVVIEAFCNGLPVVATKVGVLPEVIVPGENGFLVEINDPIDLSEKIKAAINPTFLNLAKLESAKTYNRSMSKEMAEMFYSSL